MFSIQCATVFYMSKDSLLPIDNIIPSLRRELNSHNCLVLQAEPGAGKTTRVPLALINEAWLAGQKIIMLEPRRLAAVNAARFMSKSLGEEVGNTVGYAIRNDHRVTAHTRIEVITEGILTRCLQNDPTLEGVGLIIFDEFHERNIHSDLGLALSRDVQQGLREELRIVLMSATMDSAAVSRLFDNCPIISCSGRSYPVDIVYMGDNGNRNSNRSCQAGCRVGLEQCVFAAVRRALSDQLGDVLVFLPGAREIRACQKMLNEHLPTEICIFPLYGALPYEQQQLAITASHKRKIVLATNIAETSITIAGIGAVVDSGLERRLTFNAASGMNGLITASISNASAVQRAGRAGRLQAGRCYRLWSETTQRGLQPYSTPEICATDLSVLALELALWGVPEVDKLAWLNVPPAAHMKAAMCLLNELCAVGKNGSITNRGRQISSLPLHPRLAAMIVSCGDNKQKQLLACELAVLLEEGDRWFRAEKDVASQSDIVDRLEWWRYSSKLNATGKENMAAMRSLSTLKKRLRLSKSINVEDVTSTDVGELLLAAFPDRIAKRRPDSNGYYQMRNGLGAKLSSRSHVNDAEWLVAVEVQHQGNGKSLIHQASVVNSEQIVSFFADQMPWQEDIAWDKVHQRVVGRQCQKIGALVVNQRPVAVGADVAQELILTYIRQVGLTCLNWDKASLNWLQRSRFVDRYGLQDDWPPLDDHYLLDSLERWLAPWLSGVHSATALKKIKLQEPLHSLLNWDQQQRLEKLAPVFLRLPSGSRATIDYSEPEQPVLAAKLQELFGWHSSPSIAGGRMPLTIHLLSPARRPLQVTKDLASFWLTTYPEVKKEMKGRYPKHPWPDDPLSAIAQRGVKKRGD
ncbi:MAG: ATP-dependent helicase HrpB [Desulfobacteraceae bacterium 4572_35.1]|nr:MAG: ATP-dependent helicase HrpB [Desulfobacteraceae bacterium 4572_35.1]